MQCTMCIEVFKILLAYDMMHLHSANLNSLQPRVLTKYYYTATLMAYSFHFNPSHIFSYVGSSVDLAIP